MLDDALLQGKAVMDWGCDSLAMPRIEDNSSGSAAGEGCQDGCFADVNGGYLELFEHELCQLKSQIFVVHWTLGENKRCISWIDHQLIDQALAQNVLQEIKVYYKLVNQRFATY